MLASIFSLLVGRLAFLLHLYVFMYVHVLSSTFLIKKKFINSHPSMKSFIENKGLFECENNYRHENSTQYDMFMLEEL